MDTTAIHRLNIDVGELQERMRWHDANSRGSNQQLTELAEAVQALGEFCTILDARLTLIIDAMDATTIDA